MLSTRTTRLISCIVLLALALSGLSFSANSVRAAQPDAAPASSLSTASHWLPMSTGTNDDANTQRSVSAVAVSQTTGIVYAQGDAMGACANGCNGIAQWDPSAATPAWEPMDGGMSGGSSMVGAITVSSSGIVYVGGNFAKAGSCDNGCLNIAKWDPTTSQWSQMGGGIGDSDTSIYAIAVDPISGFVYVGGNFTKAGSCISGCNNIAKWDGSTWSQMGGGTSGSTFGMVTALEVGPTGIVYAGGWFETAGSCDSAAGCSYIAQWDPSATTPAWAPLGSGMDKSVNAIAISTTGILYAGGRFTTAGTCLSGCNNIAQWDGSTWSQIGGGVSSENLSIVSDITIGSSGILYVGGNFTTAGSCSAGCTGIAQWDPAALTPAWSAVGEGTDDEVRTIAVKADTDLYAGGVFHLAGTCDLAAGCSNIATFELPPYTPVITFDTAPTPTYLGGNFTVSASSDNTETGGSTLTYSVVSGPCTLVSGSTFSSSGAGDCVIKAEGPATTNYSAGSSTQTVTIAKAQPVITFTNLALVGLKSHGFTATATTTNTDPAGTPAFSWVSGSPCAFDSGAYFTVSAKGTCVIKAASDPTTNFLAASQEQTVTVTELFFLPIVSAGPVTLPWFVTLGYEDLSLASGKNDFDYNDWGIDVSGKTTFADYQAPFVSATSAVTNPRSLIHEIDFVFTPRTRGAGYDHTFGITLSANALAHGGTAYTRIYDQNHALISSTETRFEAGSPANFVIFEKTSAVFPGEGVNTIEWTPTVLPLRTATLNLTFDLPVIIEPSFGDPHGAGLFFDPYLKVLLTGEEVHQGDLRLLAISARPTQPAPNTTRLWQWVEEGVRIDRAYPLVSFVPGNPPTITFPDGWWTTRTQCVIDGLVCNVP